MIDMPAVTVAAEIASWVFVVSGAFFVLVGAIGIVRMPDLFTRMHGASVIDTMGAGLLIIGMIIQSGNLLIALKLLFIFVLLFLVSPVATHALAQAAMHADHMPELKEDRTQTPGTVGERDSGGADRPVGRKD